MRKIIQKDLTVRILFDSIVETIQEGLVMDQTTQIIIAAFEMLHEQIMDGFVPDYVLQRASCSSGLSVEQCRNIRNIIQSQDCVTFLEELKIG